MEKEDESTRVKVVKVNRLHLGNLHLGHGLHCQLMATQTMMQKKFPKNSGSAGCVVAGAIKPSIARTTVAATA